MTADSEWRGVTTMAAAAAVVADDDVGIIKIW